MRRDNSLYDGIGVKAERVQRLEVVLLQHLKASASEIKGAGRGGIVPKESLKALRISLEARKMSTSACAPKDKSRTQISGGISKGEGPAYP